MKKIFYAVILLLPATCFAGKNTPALSQYLGQLTCATKGAFAQVETVALSEAALTQAAEACVPQDFKAEVAGLKVNLRPSTREEQIGALVRSLKSRASLCQQQKLSSSECIQMFAASED